MANPDSAALGLAVTPAQREQWQKLCQAATEGPWYWWMSEGPPWEIGSKAQHPAPHIGISVGSSSPDAEFIATAREAFPMLLQDHATLLARVAALEQQLRIEPLHAPTCPFKPYEDSYETPEDVACTCGDLSARWKARAVVERNQRREAEARVAALTAERGQLIGDLNHARHRQAALETELAQVPEAQAAIQAALVAALRQVRGEWTALHKLSSETLGEIEAALARVGAGGGAP